MRNFELFGFPNSRCEGVWRVLSDRLYAFVGLMASSVLRTGEHWICGLIDGLEFAAGEVGVWVGRGEVQGYRFPKFLRLV